MYFDHFRKDYLDYRVETGDAYEIAEARAMSHAYFLLTEDKKQRAKAKAFRDQCRAAMRKGGAA